LDKRHNDLEVVLVFYFLGWGGWRNLSAPFLITNSLIVLTIKLIKLNFAIMTYREIVSKATNTLKLNNKDDSISRRYILQLFKDSASTLISQKWLDRTILSETNLYTKIDCFDFEKVDVKSCGNIEFRYCKTLMKSFCPLPKLIYSRLGASIKEIVALDGEYRFVFLDKGQYQRNKNRQHSIKDEIYIYLDSDLHLYIPDHEIYSVDMTILTTSPEELKMCSSCDKDEKCLSNWDNLFICPDKLVTTVFNEVMQILGVNRQIREDQNPNATQGN
jgi:hypothetical protein